MTARINSDEKRQSADRDRGGRYLPGHAIAGPGRPRGVDLRCAFAEAHGEQSVEQAVVEVLGAMLTAAKAGDAAAARIILDRFAGPVRQELEHSGELGGAAALTAEEVERRVASIVAMAQARALAAEFAAPKVVAVPRAAPAPEPDDDDEVLGAAIARAQSRWRAKPNASYDLCAVAFGRGGDVALVLRSGWHFTVERQQQVHAVADWVCEHAQRVPIAIAVDTPGALALARALADRRVPVGQVQAVQLLPLLHALLAGSADITLPPGEMNHTALLALATTLTDAAPPAPMPSYFDRRRDAGGRGAEHDPYAL